MIAVFTIRTQSGRYRAFHSTAFQLFQLFQLNLDTRCKSDYNCNIYIYNYIYKY